MPTKKDELIAKCASIRKRLKNDWAEVLTKEFEDEEIEPGDNNDDDDDIADLIDEEEGDLFGLEVDQIAAV